MNAVIQITTEQFIGEYPLPAEDNRKFEIQIERICGGLTISAEIYNGTITIYSNHNIKLYVNNKSVEDTVLEGHDYVICKTGKEQLALRLLEFNDDICVFRKYDITDIKRLSIGRNDNNDIRIKSNYVGRDHCQLVRNGDKWSLLDSSTNGTYVNCERVESKIEIDDFDIIYVSGVKLIIASGCIAINYSKLVETNLNELTDNTNGYIDKYEVREVLIRSPKELVPLFMERVHIDELSMPEDRKDRPTILTIGPSLTMPLPIITSVLISASANISSSTMLISSISSVGLMAIFAVMWSVINHNYTKREGIERKREIADRYEKYLSDIEELLKSKHEYNKKALEQNYFSSKEVVSDVVVGKTEFLWNGSAADNDFLNVRIGVGSIKFQGDIKIPEKRFGTVANIYNEKLEKINQKYSIIDEAVITLDLKKIKCIGLIGDAADCYSVMRSIAIQTTAKYDNNEVKTCFVYGSEERHLFDWVRWLPHTRDNDGFRLVSDTDERNIEIVRRLESYNNQNLQTVRISDFQQKKLCYILFITAKNRLPYDAVAKLLASETAYVIFVFAYGKREYLPSECRNLLYCTDKSQIVSLDDVNCSKNVSLEKISIEKSDTFARHLFRIAGIIDRSFSIPDSIALTDALELKRVEDFSITKQYKLNRAYESIKIFLGVGKGGEKVYLDMHERGAGPHGLIAGMTGSGKSELLQTMVITTALSYSPEEIAFLFIDYKGGGMADAFRNLPHNAGIITNLNDNGNEGLGAGILNRALISVVSERIRRQELFREHGVNHIDDYQKLYRNGNIDMPLPHLIIICDEFSELKVEQPEFIREIVRTSRVGRSLGIHLILATQKPTGAVDEDIFANSRFRICLRVQDKGDSYEMLHRYEASDLKNVGRGYLQIGNNERFELFQTAYSGAKYETIDSSDVSKAVSILNKYGERYNSGTKSLIDKRAKSQLDVIVEYISSTCNYEGIKSAMKLWQEPLPSLIELKELHLMFNKEDGLIPFGIADIPAKQKKQVSSINIESDGNIIITGTQGSGKTNFLRTIIFLPLCYMIVSNLFSIHWIVVSLETLQNFLNVDMCQKI